MKLESLCSFDREYVGDLRLVRPYGNEGGLSWGHRQGCIDRRPFGRNAQQTGKIPSSARAASGVGRTPGDYR